MSFTKHIIRLIALALMMFPVTASAQNMWSKERVLITGEALDAKPHAAIIPLVGRYYNDEACVIPAASDMPYDVFVIMMDNNNNGGVVFRLGRIGNAGGNYVEGLDCPLDTKMYASGIMADRFRRAGTDTSKVLH